MGATGGAAGDAAVAGARLAILPNKVHHVKEIAWKRIALLAASCFWFWVTTSLAFLIRFMTRRVFRREEDSSRHSSESNSESIQLLEKLIEDSRTEEEDSDASKETSVFQFRFSFQVPEESISSREVQGNPLGEDMGSAPSARTSVSNYRFLFERDFSGFLEAPQAMTMCVQESYMGSEGLVLENSQELDWELRSRFSSVKRFQKADSDAGDIGHGGGEVNHSLASDVIAQGNSEELDVELNRRLSLVKSSGRVGKARTEKASHQSLDSDGVVPDKDSEVVDRELKTRLSLVRLPSQDYSAAGGAVDGDEEVCRSFYRDGDVLEDLKNTEELDRDLTTRFLSVKTSHLDTGAAVSHGDGMGKSLLHLDTLNKTEETGELGPVIQFSDQENQLHVVGLPGEPDVPAGAHLPLAKDSHWVDSDSESDSTSDGYSVKDLNSDFDSDGFLSERDFEQETEKGHLLNWDRVDEESPGSHQKSEETRLPNPQGTDDGNFVDSDRKDEEFIEDLKNFVDINLEILHNSFSPSAIHDDVLPDGEAELNPTEEAGTSNSTSSNIHGEENGRVSESASTETTKSPNSQNPEALVNAYLLGENSDVKEHIWEDSHKELHSQEDRQDSEVTRLGKPKELSLEESEELESLWEHQDLIDQLRMELRKVRSAGLPTILEESESPKSIEDVKPWKFDTKFLHEDPMDELNKFYKSYRERMRKFDILNYQKMYAVGFLQLKDPLESMGTHKPLIPTITSLLSQNIRLRRRKSATDPSEKFVRELQSDLETVYVGQSCLSWEFLRWQYEKTREFLEPDPLIGRRYNQVAGEFQQFQVLLQRFIEDEPFHGPRVPNYVKNRCVLRSLLQVPVIREDCLKDKLEEKSKVKDSNTSDHLEYIMEESIRVFWEFVKADRDDSPAIVKGLMRSHFDLQDPEDIELMVEIQATLQRKEKKLKDLVRTGNCLVKKFKKPREGRPNQDDLFFSQVDLRLVARVLRMTRITTDQLVWCHKKLSKITFVDRKLVREPSFLLFPC